MKYFLFSAVAFYLVLGVFIAGGIMSDVFWCNSQDSFSFAQASRCVDIIRIK